MPIITYNYISTVYPLMIEKEQKREQNCTSFVIHHSNFGWIIIDSGSFIDRDSFIDQLKSKFNITPDNVNYVINTHLHFDHFGNNEIFNNAKVILSKKELNFFKSISEIFYNEPSDIKVASYLSANFSGFTSISLETIKNLRKYFADCWDIKKLGNNILYLEDKHNILNSIKPVYSPGHTLYHYSFQLSVDNQNIYILGDAIAKKSILEKDSSQKASFGMQMDYELYFNSLEKLRNQRGLMVPGHDNPFLQ